MKKHKKIKQRDKEIVLQSKYPASQQGKELFETFKQKSRMYMHNYIADTNIKIKFKNKYIAICASADWHLGHAGVDYNRLEKDLKIIANIDNFYMVFLGDAIDNFIDAEKHKEAIINAESSPKEQLYMFQYAMSFFGKKPGDKILFAVKDNHVSHRLKRATGVDYFNKIWDEYGVFYGSEEILAELNFNKVKYRFLARHSYKGKSNLHLTASCKNLLKTGMYEDVDIVGLGHTHEGAIELFPFRGKLRCAIQAATYKIIDPYADRLGFVRPQVIMPVVILNPFKKDFIVATSVEEAAYILKKLNK
jgi:predicted MPP superfamily phosphohydrolase